MIYSHILIGLQYTWEIQPQKCKYQHIPGNRKSLQSYFGGFEFDMNLKQNVPILHPVYQNESTCYFNFILTLRHVIALIN